MQSAFINLFTIDPQDGLPQYICRLGGFSWLSYLTCLNASSPHLIDQKTGNLNYKRGAVANVPNPTCLHLKITPKAIKFQ
jgi:hypothetical protein